MSPELLKLMTAARRLSDAEKGDDDLAHQQAECDIWAAGIEWARAQPLEGVPSVPRTETVVQVHGEFRNGESHLCWQHSPDEFAKLEPFTCDECEFRFETRDDLEEFSSVVEVPLPTQRSALLMSPSEEAFRQVLECIAATSTDLETRTLASAILNEPQHRTVEQRIAVNDLEDELVTDAQKERTKATRRAEKSAKRATNAKRRAK